MAPEKAWPLSARNASGNSSHPNGDRFHIIRRSRIHTVLSSNKHWHQNPCVFIPSERHHPILQKCNMQRQQLNRKWKDAWPRKEDGASSRREWHGGARGKRAWEPRVAWCTGDEHQQSWAQRPIHRRTSEQVHAHGSVVTLYKNVREWFERNRNGHGGEQPYPGLYKRKK